MFSECRDHVGASAKRNVVSAGVGYADPERHCNSKSGSVNSFNDSLQGKNELLGTLDYVEIKP